MINPRIWSNRLESIPMFSPINIYFLSGRFKTATYLSDNPACYGITACSFLEALSCCERLQNIIVKAMQRQYVLTSSGAQWRSMVFITATY